MFRYEQKKGCDFFIGRRLLLQVRVSDDTYTILKQKSIEYEVSTAHIVRIALNQYFKKKGWKK